MICISSSRSNIISKDIKWSKELPLMFCELFSTLDLFMAEFLPEICWEEIAEDFGNTNSDTNPDFDIK